RWPARAFWTSSVLAPVPLIQTAPALGPVAVGGSFMLQRYFPRGQDLGPAGAPLLSIRAARRAIAESPDDPQAYVNLAEAYIRLKNQEDLWTGKPPNFDLPRQALRQMQIVTA